MATPGYKMSMNYQQKWGKSKSLKYLQKYLL